jgi:hypothetical protein
MKTGLPLDLVGASTFGANGGVPCRRGGLFRLCESGFAIGRGASAGEAISEKHGRTQRGHVAKERRCSLRLAPLREPMPNLRRNRQ